MPKRKCVKNPIVDLNEENTFSGDESDEWKVDDSKSDTESEIDDIVDEVQNNSKKTKSDFSTSRLQIHTNIKRSNHPVWEFFGCLQKDSKIIGKTKDRIFCKKCLETNKIKG